MKAAIPEDELLYEFICFCYGTRNPEAVVNKKRLILVTHFGRNKDYHTLKERLEHHGFGWFDLRSIICLDSQDILGTRSIQKMLTSEFGDRKEIHRGH